MGYAEAAAALLTLVNTIVLVVHERWIRKVKQANGKVGTGKETRDR
jgi:uncharacterized membrane protein